MRNAENFFERPCNYCRSSTSSSGVHEIADDYGDKTVVWFIVFLRRHRHICRWLCREKGRLVVNDGNTLALMDIAPTHNIRLWAEIQALSNNCQNRDLVATHYQQCSLSDLLLYTVYVSNSSIQALLLPSSKSFLCRNISLLLLSVGIGYP